MAYCTQTDLELRASVLGLQLRGDYLRIGVADPAVVAQAIEAGDSEINLYCGWLYSETALGNCTWVNHASIALSLWFFCGNEMEVIPQSVQANYDRVVKQLEKVQEGKLKLPGVARRNKHTPSLTNQRVDLGYGTKKLRVERVISKEQSPQHKQNVDYLAERNATSDL